MLLNFDRGDVSMGNSFLRSSDKRTRDKSYSDLVGVMVSDLCHFEGDVFVVQLGSLVLTAFNIIIIIINEC